MFKVKLLFPGVGHFNEEASLRKLVVEGQFKDNIEKRFSRRQLKVYVEGQLADICKRKSFV